MKISAMNNEQATEAMIRLAEPFGNICNDDDALRMIDDLQKMSKQPLVKTIGKMLPQIVTYALKTHKVDLYEIVGALTFQTKEAVAKMNFLETVRTIRDSYDEILQSFFPSSATQGNNTVEK